MVAIIRGLWRWDNPDEPLKPVINGNVNTVPRRTHLVTRVDAILRFECHSQMEDQSGQDGA